MKSCPRCKHGVIQVTPVLVAKTGTYSISGAQTKVVAEQKAIVSCDSCDLNVKGRLENATLADDGITFTGGYFVSESQ